MVPREIWPQCPCEATTHAKNVTGEVESFVLAWIWDGLNLCQMLHTLEALMEKSAWSLVTHVGVNK